MDKIEKALEKTRRKEEGAKKWIVVVGIVVGLIVSFCLFVGVLCIADVNSYVKNTTVNHIYDIYDKKIDENRNVIFLLGDSGIGYSAYPPYIDDILLETGYNFSSHNLHQGSDVPLMRAIQTQNIIDSKPSVVIYGLSYRHISDFENWIPERIFVVHDRLNIRNDSLYLYTEEELETFDKTMNIIDMKMFVESAFQSKYFSNPERPGTPWHENGIYYDLGVYRERMQSSEEQIRVAALDPNNSFRPKITNETTRNKEALTYIIKTLTENDIPVILVVTPLNPILSKEISETSRNNFHDYLNSTGVSWLDLEQSLDKNYFVDIYHVNEEGMFFVSQEIADFVIQEVEANAIHYA